MANPNSAIGLRLVVDDVPVVKFFGPGTWRVHVFAPDWDSRTFTLKTGLSDDSDTHTPVNTLTENGQFLVNGGCFVSIVSSGDYVGMSALASTAVI